MLTTTFTKLISFPFLKTPTVATIYSVKRYTATTIGRKDPIVLTKDTVSKLSGSSKYLHARRTRKRYHQ